MEFSFCCFVVYDSAKISKLSRYSKSSKRRFAVGAWVIQIRIEGHSAPWQLVFAFSKGLRKPLVLSSMTSNEASETSVFEWKEPVFSAVLHCFKNIRAQDEPGEVIRSVSFLLRFPL